jgi:hypothetical protein
MSGVDVLVVTALAEQHEAARLAALTGFASNPGSSGLSVPTMDASTRCTDHDDPGVAVQPENNYHAMPAARPRAVSLRTAAVVSVACLGANMAPQLAQPSR